MNLTRRDWELGWVPSADSVNGDPRGLLKLDNLTHKEDGSLTLARGTQPIISPYPAPVVDIFSVNFQSNQKFRYVGLTNGQCYRNGWLLFDDGGYRTVFALVYGNVLIASGRNVKKDDGSDLVPLRNLGIDKPPAPNVVPFLQPVINYTNDPYTTNYIVEEGTLAFVDPFSIGAIMDQNTLRIVFRTSYGGDKDLLNFNGFPSKDPNTDRFQFTVRIGDSSLLTDVRLEFHLDQDLDTSENYYFFEWHNTDDGPFNQGINRNSVLEANRGDFIRAGNSDDDWRNVKHKRVILKFNSYALTDANLISGFFLFGGALGPLNGYYDYVVVYAYNNGTYVAKSPPSDAVTMVYTKNSSVQVSHQFPNAFEVNEVWIFRRSRTLAEDNKYPLGILDKFYRVGVVPIGQDFIDVVSDDDALKLNITLNEFIIPTKSIPDEIIEIIGPYFDRTLFLTRKEIWISELLNPDAVDPRYTIKISGDNTESNLWFAKVSEGVILLATTRDFYTISGTFADLPDGTIDVIVRPLGEKHLSLSRDHTKSDLGIVYPSADGWRIHNGEVSVLISSQLSLLWQGYTRYEVPPVAIYPFDLAVYPCIVYKNELWTSVPNQDGTRRCYIYDFIRKRWRAWYSDPIAFGLDEDGTLLGGYGGGSGNALRQLDVGNSLDNQVGQIVDFWTIFDDNGQPRNRKDVFTLKVTADTGGKPVNIYLAKDGKPFIDLGKYTFNGIEEKLIEIATIVGIGFRYALRIRGSDLNKFTLYNFTIEYDPRPEQLNYLRISPTNLGSFSRKRFTNFAFVIDTLGNTIQYTPLIDNVPYQSSTFSTSEKSTYIHYFKQETIGIDIGGILQGGTFEFYGLNLEETVSEKLPTPVKFLVIPQSDYGIPNRKRHSSYKFQINTRGKLVRFVPKLDGVFYAPLDFSTTEKSTVEYFFTADTIAIDIGGTLESLEDEAFEFYGVIVPQEVEILPPRLKEFRTSETNFGIAAPKRIRVIPFTINTNGSPIQFTPIVDNVPLAPSTHITTTKQTVYHYFTTDVFGTDIAAEITGSVPFEFYGILTPEAVETLPVPKKFDQLGPIRIDKLGKLLSFRIRLIATDGFLPYKIISENEATLPFSTGSSGEISGVINTRQNVDEVYEVTLPKTIKGTVFRFEFGPTMSPFYRYDLQIKVNMSGMETDSKWVKVR